MGRMIRKGKIFGRISEKASLILNGTPERSNDACSVAHRVVKETMSLERTKDVSRDITLDNGTRFSISSRPPRE